MNKPQAISLFLSLSVVAAIVGVFANDIRALLAAINFALVAICFQLAPR